MEKTPISLAGYRFLKYGGKKEDFPGSPTKAAWKKEAKKKRITAGWYYAEPDVADLPS